MNSSWRDHLVVQSTSSYDFPRVARRIESSGKVCNLPRLAVKGEGGERDPGNHEGRSWAFPTRISRISSRNWRHPLSRTLTPWKWMFSGGSSEVLPPTSLRGIRAGDNGFSLAKHVFAVRLLVALRRFRLSRRTSEESKMLAVKTEHSILIILRTQTYNVKKYNTWKNVNVIPRTAL